MFEEVSVMDFNQSKYSQLMKTSANGSELEMVEVCLPEENDLPK